VTSLFRRDRDDGDRDDLAEMEAHLLHRTDELVNRGIEADEARRIAEEEFGDRDQIAAQVRTEKARNRRRGSSKDLLDVLRQDLGFTLRQFRRAPGFAAVAMFTLMLGIGVTVTIVTVVRAVVLDPLPFVNSDEVVYLNSVTPDGSSFGVADVGFLTWRDQATSFDGVAASTARGATLRSPGQPEAILRGYVSAGFFAVLGSGIELGREFSTTEAAPRANIPVALISHAFWTERFSGSRDVVGQAVDLNGELFEIVGVVDASMEILFEDTPVITPLTASHDGDADEHYLDVIGRLRPDVTQAQASRELASITATLNVETGEDDGWSARVEPAVDRLVGQNTLRAGWVLLVAAGLLLGTACLNVSSLLLARATVRTTEMGIRAALGAGRARIFGQLMTESGVLALAGGLLGVGLTAVALPIVRTLGAGTIPRLEHAVFDPDVLLVAGTAILVATLTFGSAPLIAMRGKRLVSGSARGRTTPGTGTRRLLVVAQIAVSLVLLIGTGLLSRSFVELMNVDPGFEPVGAVAISISMPPANYTPQDRADLLRAILTSVEGLPEVERAGATAIDPFSGNGLGNAVAPRDHLPERAQDFTSIAWRVVTPGLFEAMGVDLLAGRSFDNSDLETTGPESLVPIVIGDRLARMLYGSADEALGKVLVWGDLGGSHQQILGVVEDLVDVDLGAEPEPMLYRLHAEVPWAVMSVIARLRPGSTDIGDPLREAVASAAPGLPVPEVRLLESTLERTLAEPRFNFVLLASFAAVGLLLAVIGLYGLTTFEVQQRFREIGIRLSLGARPEAIQSMILRERAVLGASGIAIGLIVAVLASRYVEALLFGITPRDPYTWVGVVLLLSLTVGLAGYLPARRATNIHPREILSGD